jgi:hypothetical protein
MSVSFLPSKRRLAGGAQCDVTMLLKRHFAKRNIGSSAWIHQDGSHPDGFPE